MLNLIDEKYRLVFILYYLEGFRIPEIAGFLGMNKNTVKTRLARAREQLRTALRLHYEERAKVKKEKTFKQLLDERSLYHKEIGFDEQSKNLIFPAMLYLWVF